MPLIERLTALLAEVEGTYGTDPTPTAADDAISALDLSIVPQMEVHDRDVQSSVFSNLVPVRGKQWYEVSFKTHVKWNNNTGGLLADFQDTPLWRAAGCARTRSGVTPDVQDAIDPSSSGSLDSATLYCFKDGVRHVVRGVRLNAKMILETGKPGFIEWSGKGLYQTPTDVATPTLTYDSTDPPAVLSSSFSYAAVTTPIPSKLEFDLGNVISERPSSREATGIVGFIITARKPTIKIDPEQLLVATRNLFNDIANSTSIAIAIDAGSTNGNIVQLRANTCYMKTLGEGSREGVRTHEMEFVCAGTSNNEFQIVYT